ncbi:hypothetical protein T02_1187 [Trichinella nativa]|uniref:Uncharacterized protein n=1 Tax=Trichinella nativa TaxID=6335 RepID=A0A0V1LMB4_9BILA|nr:hypothetical protein T02_1187 [Trichinella nativa]
MRYKLEEIYALPGMVEQHCAVVNRFHSPSARPRNSSTNRSNEVHPTAISASNITGVGQNILPPTTPGGGERRQAVMEPQRTLGPNWHRQAEALRSATSPYADWSIGHRNRSARGTEKAGRA